METAQTAEPTRDKCSSFPPSFTPNKVLVLWYEVLIIEDILINGLAIIIKVRVPFRVELVESSEPNKKPPAAAALQGGHICGAPSRTVAARSSRLGRVHELG